MVAGPPPDVSCGKSQFWWRYLWRLRRGRNWSRGTRFSRTSPGAYVKKILLPQSVADVEAKSCCDSCPICSGTLVFLRLLLKVIMRLSSKPFRVEMSLFPPMATRRGQGLFGFKKMVTYHLVFITYYLSLNFHHSSFITHHLKHFIPFGTITHLSSLNIFQLLVSPIPVPCAAFFFFLFFPSTPSTHRTQWEKNKIK